MGAVSPRDWQGSADAALYWMDESGGEDHGDGRFKRRACARRTVNETPMEMQMVKNVGSIAMMTTHERNEAAKTRHTLKTYGIGMFPFLLAHHSPHSRPGYGNTSPPCIMLP